MNAVPTEWRGKDGKPLSERAIAKLVFDTSDDDEKAQMLGRYRAVQRGVA